MPVKHVSGPKPAMPVIGIKASHYVHPREREHVTSLESDVQSCFDQRDSTDLKSQMPEDLVGLVGWLMLTQDSVTSPYSSSPARATILT